MTRSPWSSLAPFLGYLPAGATYWSCERSPGYKRRLGSIFGEKSLKIGTKMLDCTARGAKPRRRCIQALRSLTVIAERPVGRRRAFALRNQQGHAAGRTQRHARHRLRLVPGDRPKTKGADQNGQYDCRLDGGETRPDANAWPATERQIGITRARLDLVDGEAIGIEGGGVVPQTNVPVQGEHWDMDAGARTDLHAAKLDGGVGL